MNQITFKQSRYAHDDIGNRTSTKAGGDAVGSSLRLATYSPNSLNQYTNRTVPGAVDILGIANVAAGVTVNSQTTYRKGEYYQKALTVVNSSAPVYQSVTNTAVNAGSTSNLIGNIFVPAATENFTNDLDGNMSVDGRWTYTWDAENRLAKLEANSNVPDAAKRKLEFEYDHRARRISKKVYTWNGSSYVLQSTTRFLYDAWNLLTELDGNNTLLRSYMWGLDLSGSLQGAGGVGGLLAMKPSGGAAQFAAYDGNGNVTALADGSTGTASANYEYSPFGETIRMTGGAQASANKCRFSTKYVDDESDFLYYGYRLLNPSMGRWLSRDPLDEKGGLNLLVFAKNTPQTSFDTLGLHPIIIFFPPIIIEPRLDVWDRLYERFRDEFHWGPLRACIEANNFTGQSRPCSALGRDPRPKLYCGCNNHKILKAAEWLRYTADGRPAGADKLAHCYAFCVSTVYYGGATYFFTRDSDPEDVRADEIGRALGRGISLTGTACDCLEKCAVATYGMDFNK